MAPGYQPIQQLLESTRRRLRRVALAEALLVLATGLLALLLVATGAAALGWLGRPLQIVAAAVVIALGVYLTRRYVLRPAREHRADDDVARFVATRAPHLRSHLISAVQFQASLPELEQTQEVSPALARSHIAWTVENLGEVAPSELVPWRQSRPKALVLAAALVVSLIVGALVPG